MKLVTGLLATVLLLAGVGASHAVVRIAEDRGGRIGTYVDKYQDLRSSGETVGDDPEFVKALSGDLPVPTTSIFSRSDGVVNWRTCLLRPSATAENVEVHLASHVDLGVNPAVLWAVADRLSQQEGQFSQFDRSGPFAIAYAPPERAQS